MGNLLDRLGGVSYSSQYSSENLLLGGSVEACREAGMPEEMAGVMPAVIKSFGRVNLQGSFLTLQQQEVGGNVLGRKTDYLRLVMPWQLLERVYEKDISLVKDYGADDYFMLGLIQRLQGPNVDVVLSDGVLETEGMVSIVGMSARNMVMAGKRYVGSFSLGREIEVVAYREPSGRIGGINYLLYSNGELVEGDPWLVGVTTRLEQSGEFVDEGKAIGFKDGLRGGPVEARLVYESKEMAVLQQCRAARTLVEHGLPVDRLRDESFVSDKKTWSWDGNWPLEVTANLVVAMLDGGEEVAEWLNRVRVQWGDLWPNYEKSEVRGLLREIVNYPKVWCRDNLGGVSEGFETRDVEVEGWRGQVGSEVVGYWEQIADLAGKLCPVNSEDVGVLGCGRNIMDHNFCLADERMTKESIRRNRENVASQLRKLLGSSRLSEEDKDKLGRVIVWLGEEGI